MTDSNITHIYDPQKEADQISQNILINNWNQNTERKQSISVPVKSKF